MARLEVEQADVTRLEVDAIANAANTQLAHGGGVAGAIARAGGPDVQRESNERAPIGLGRGGGDHRRADARPLGDPRGDDGAGRPHVAEPIIERATRSTLEVAERLGCRSLALVAFGTGVGGFPLEEAARTMVGVAREHEGGTRADRVRRARRRRPSAPSATSCERPGAGSPGQLQGHVQRLRGGRRDRRGAARGRPRRPWSCPWPTAARARWTCCSRRSAASAAAPPSAIRWGARWRPSSRLLARRPQRAGGDRAGERPGPGGRGGARRLAGEHPRHRRADRRRRGGGGRARGGDGRRLRHHRRRRGRARGPGRRPGWISRSRWSATCARRSRTPRACSPPRRAPTRRP